jgi:hypothetical protein
MRPASASASASLVALLVFSATAVQAADAAADPMQPLALSFVSAALALRHVPGQAAQIDSYFGPPSLDAPPDEAPTLDMLSDRVRTLVADIDAQQMATPSARGARLSGQVRSLNALLGQARRPGSVSFEDEASGVYDMDMPLDDRQGTAHRLKALESLLPGTGDVSQRLQQFRSRFLVPSARRQVVFERALEACRQQTQAHWQLPPAEHLEVQWTDEVAAAWHRYRGDDRSTLQINPRSIAEIGQMLDVACHEAYPGHHAQFLLLDQAAGADGPAVEDTVVLLHSPASVLREGAANYGVSLAFSPRQRVTFDTNVLFPLAGLDPAQARRYEQVKQLTDELSSAATPVLAAYRDGRMTFGEAAVALRTDALIDSPAELLRYADEHGAYVLGYAAARERVRTYVNLQTACTGADAWTVLAEVVSEPRVAVLREQAAQGAHCVRASHVLFRVQMLGAPDPVPINRYFGFELAIVDGRDPTRRITDARVEVSAGMSHGGGSAFTHGMQSLPVVEKKNGSYLVRGMLFHMAGPWTVRVKVHHGASTETTDLRLECSAG